MPDRSAPDYDLTAVLALTDPRQYRALFDREPRVGEQTFGLVVDRYPTDRPRLSAKGLAAAESDAPNGDGNGP